MSKWPDCMQLLQHLVLARWPGHLATSEDVQVEVVNRLSPVSSIVDHYPKTIVKFLLSSYFVCSQQKMTKKRVILLCSIAEHRQPLLGNHKDMSWCLRRDITEGQALVILIHNVSWDGLVNDLVEDGGLVFAL